MSNNTSVMFPLFKFLFFSNQHVIAKNANIKIWCPIQNKKIFVVLCCIKKISTNLLSKSK
jgi:hypothetical protein